MNTLYKSLGITKQSFHQRMDRHRAQLSEQKQLLLLIYQIREDHPTMGCRDMYYKLKPESMGRDAFELFCKGQGFAVPVNRDFRRTTDSSGVVRFDNLLGGLAITYINQVWQSDITYYEVNGRFYYITFILDAYSRRIIGYRTSKRLLTEQTSFPALQMAIKQRKGHNFEGVIFHSDGGGQYYDKAFLQLTSKYNIKNSMCEYPWENGKAERINGVIKNNYLKHRQIDSYGALVKEVDRSVRLYNEEKPHSGLQRKSPVQFEKEYIWGDCKSNEGEASTKKTAFSKENMKISNNYSSIKTVNAI